jgi:hypothetical protein
MVKIKKTSKTNDKVSAIMTKALFSLRDLVDNDEEYETDYHQVVTLFLQGVISTAIDLTELHTPGISPMIYANIEASSKLGGLRSIARMQSEKGTISYSVSDIGEHDLATAMNYLGQQLSTTLFKGIHELPLPLRKQEMLLRGVEALLTNLLNEKFDNSHDILDSFCEHVHMSLNDLETRAK